MQLLVLRGPTLFHSNLTIEDNFSDKQTGLADFRALLLSLYFNLTQWRRKSMAIGQVCALNSTLCLGNEYHAILRPLSIVWSMRLPSGA